MQVNYSFKINAKGTKEELKAILGTLKSIENKEFDVFLNSIMVKTSEDWIELKKISDEKSIDTFIADSDGSIEINAKGPYGHYRGLSNTTIFESIANAAPFATFSGSIEGGSIYTTENIHCALKDAKLHIECYYLDHEELDYEYSEFLKREMPYERFVKLFKVDENNLDKGDYEEEVASYLNLQIDYEEFKEQCPASAINENEYEEITEQLWAEGLDYIFFVDSYEGGSTKEYEYNPIDQVYLDAVRNDHPFETWNSDDL